MRIIVLLLCALFAAPALAADERPAPKTISEFTHGLQKIDGFVPLYWDASTGKLHMEISRFGEEILFMVSLPAGLGSNPVGLDRGAVGGGRVVVFERVGPRVLLVARNYRYRASSANPAERRAVEDSFARSVLWGFEAEAFDGARVLVDATAFFLRDANGISDAIRRAEQGSYGLDASRSAIYLPRTKAFPKNTEVEALLTFTTSGDPGPYIYQTTPDPKSVSVRQHVSFVALPESGYTPRRYDPRVGAIDVMFYDYSTPITEPIEQHYVVRHRLQKKDPSAALSEPVEPIVYYVDSGAPEPIRSALVEGASWWNEAFEAAGFKNAFHVRVLPDDADPMDVRYNVVNWTHRATRGWSFGGSVIDPRTGEIIKGNVVLGSLRVRQDYMLGVGLVSPYAGEFGDMPDPEYLAAAADPATDAAAMSLARIRQLAAHEVGHAIGFEHNFAASTYGRGSVMDYPAPMVEIKNGKLDLSNAYARGIGAYDKFAATYSYAQFRPGANEAAELAKIVEAGIEAGMLFIGDGDARPPSSAHPLASLWDNGADSVAMLRHEMEVRRIGLSQFGLASIREGTPLSSLEATLVPLYLHHRFQLQAAMKSIGGLSFAYSVKTAKGPVPAQAREVVRADRQREALAAVLDTLSIDALALPPRILALIPPTAPSFDGGTAEYFPSRTSPAFDAVGVAAVAAGMPISGLLDPRRAARLIQFNGENPKNPDFAEVVDALVTRTWGPRPEPDAYRAAVRRAVQRVVADRLMDLAANADASPDVRAVATDALRRLSASLKASANAAGAARADAAHRRAVRDDVERFLSRPAAPHQQTNPLPVPQGEPIGG
jgi:hypothetical protein